MNEPWVVVVVGVATLLLGAPVMSALGAWIQGRFGLLTTKTEAETDLAKEARNQEYARHMAWQARQDREMDNLRAKAVTYEDALRDTVRRCDDLEREVRDLRAKVEQLNGELERVRAENVALKSRVAELERDNYRLLAELEALRR
jgi:chromosome segregation ATPase